MEGGVTGKRAAKPVTTVQDCVFIMYPAGEEIVGQFPAAFVAPKVGVFDMC